VAAEAAIGADRPRLANFVIGGTEKAGTTSVFDYLSAHPQVCASTRKETDFFRNEYSGDRGADARRYGAYFERCDARAVVLMEASPGYLGEAATVAPRLRSLVPDARLLFILRDPVDRFQSSYEFHRGRLNLPPGMGLDDYLQRCLDYDRGRTTASAAGLDPWYLKVLRFGCYAEFIDVFRLQMPPANLKVMFFESLCRNEREFMVELSAFLRIEREFWTGFRFRPSNVTFSGRNQLVHRWAMRANLLAEPMLRRFPAAKRALVGAYKALNQEREGYDPMPQATRERLIAYYRPSVAALARQPGVSLPDSWNYLLHGASA
jgi:hypothetical protein